MAPRCILLLPVATSSLSFAFAKNTALLGFPYRSRDPFPPVMGCYEPPALRKSFVFFALTQQEIETFFTKSFPPPFLSGVGEQDDPPPPYPNPPPPPPPTPPPPQHTPLTCNTPPEEDPFIMTPSPPFCAANFAPVCFCRPGALRFTIMSFQNKLPLYDGRAFM